MVQGIIAGGMTALTRSIEGAEDNARSGAADLQAAGCCPGDIVIGIAASGRTPYVLGAVEKARMLGAVTGGVSCSAAAQLSAAVEYPVEVVVGAEVVAGSTRLRAGTATKLVLNMITTATMVRLGYVYGNLMVNVQPTNGKLLDRARRIVAQATGLDAAGAETLLEQAGRSVRTAIVMEKKRISREQAEVLLRQARGRIREALAVENTELG
jgi:N-acetylmuramic acid 6-phosphate etherase